MIELAPDAPGKTACGRSGLPLIAVCACGIRRSVPFVLRKTHGDDETPLYGRPLKCFACGRTEVVLLALDSLAELDRVRKSLTYPPTGACGITTPTGEKTPRFL